MPPRSQRQPTGTSADGRRHRPDGRHRALAAARARPQPRGRAVVGDGPAAVRPRPSTACSKTEYRQGDVLDRDASTTRRRRRRRRPPRVPDRRRPRGDRSGSTSRARATCSRPTVAAGAQRLVYASSVAAYGFHADNPAAADRGRPAARHRPPLLLGPEGRARGRAERGRSRAPRPRPTSFRPCIVAGPDALAAAGEHPLHPAVGARCPAAVLRAARAACRCSSRCSPTRACPSSSSTTTTWRPRCAPPCWAAARRASTTWPARAS